MQTIPYAKVKTQLKTGDCFAFYHTKWYYLFSKMISFVSDDFDAKIKKMDHIGCVSSVKKKKGQMMFAEQTVKSGAVTELYSFDTLKEHLQSGGRKVYYCKLKTILITEQRDKLQAYFANNATEKYSLKEAGIAGFFSAIHKIRWIMEIQRFIQRTFRTVVYKKYVQQIYHDPESHNEFCSVYVYVGFWRSQIVTNDSFCDFLESCHGCIMPIQLAINSGLFDVYEVSFD
jgi:hypothetical protein